MVRAARAGGHPKKFALNFSSSAMLSSWTPGFFYLLFLLVQFGYYHTDPSFSSSSSWILGIVVQKLTTRLVFIYLCSLSPRCWQPNLEQKVGVQRFQWRGKKSINRENNPHLRPEVDSNSLPSDLLSNQSDRRWFSFLWTLMPKKMDRG